MTTDRLLAAAVVAVLALSAGPAQARFVELTPGPEGADSAPYEFFPALPRGSHDTIYAFREAEGHSFETFLRFDLPPDLLGPDEEVARAFLILFHSIDTFSIGSVEPGPGTLECRETLSDWSEATLTWSSKPSYGPPVDTITGIEALGYLSCNVPELVQAWATGERPNYGFALTSPTTRILGFYSFEANVDPLLKANLTIDIQPVPEAGGGMAAGAAIAALAMLVRRSRRQGSAP